MKRPNNIGGVAGERCYTVLAKGGGVIHIRAAVRPTGKTLEALQSLFDAAYKHLTKAPPMLDCKGLAPGARTGKISLRE